ncbi:MAG: ABC transporter permease [Rhodospirillales bacterium]|nr:ABC transporter permease [Rhodospirillales bacterium]
MTNRSLKPYLEALPYALLLVLIVGVPIATLITISFWETDGLLLYPAFSFENYRELFTSSLTLTLYLDTIKFTLLTLFFSMIIGFTCSYFLVFFVKSLKVQIALFLLCTVPFWTSATIRMISWVPFLGKEGVFNSAVQGIGLTDTPLEFLLFSDFAVVLTYVHLFTLFMIVPIFNSMSKISPSVIEAARDAGANDFDILINIIIPLTKTGIALGSIFIVALVMGDFFVVRIMSGGQSASVVSAMKNEIDQLYYPQAAAAAVLLIAMVLIFVSLILRVVDIRTELAR